MSNITELYNKSLPKKVSDLKVGDFITILGYDKGLERTARHERDFHPKEMLLKKFKITQISECIVYACYRNCKAHLVVRIIAPPSKYNICTCGFSLGNINGVELNDE